MTKLTVSLLASLSLAATSFAGQEISSGKDMKGSKELPPATCFNDRELQLDLFGVYQVGHGPDHAGNIHDHAFGGGVGVNYFFMKYVGIGAEGYWDEGHHNSAQTNDSRGSRGSGRGTRSGNDGTVFHNANGSLIFRMPIDRLCLAPYAFVGGGAAFDGKSWGLGFVGVGLEYRVVPNKVGLFADARWNYYGDRFDHDDQNNFTVRTGVRVVF